MSKKESAVADTSAQSSREAKAQRVAKAKRVAKAHCGHGPNKLVIAAVAGLAITAVVSELAKPAEERTWTGFVAKVVPYDFTVPTVDKIKARLWNPEGPVLGPHIFGIGWTPNFGRLAQEAKHLAEDAAAATN
ncbi:MAG: hypothetical protein LBH13_08350 [Cellulomonadaceae bacterium]|jgi:hypothetical protein|nr:hypothetical protein [Cellulomonadaceae bacterium]